MKVVELVHLKPNAGATPRLLELRPHVISQYETHFKGRFSATLSELEDGTWMDIWLWEDRAIAEEGLARGAEYSAFLEWQTLVELVSLKWATIVDVDRKPSR